MTIDELLIAAVLVERFGLPPAVAFRGSALDLDHAQRIYFLAGECGCLGCTADAFAVGRSALLRYPREGGPWKA